MEISHKLTLGSLFDGSGGFPLGGLICDIVPVWAAEIEPFPVRVTTKRMPFMKHYGDVSAMDGGKIEPVDIITFGSPCQDMSVAGKRSGLGGNRSCLFYEAVRIIKEMRCATNGKYPRFAVWENVPGAFSSNGGEDFRAVLDTLCKVKDKQLSIPRPAGRWANAGEIVADGFSVAWRVLDAQFWGVPQRRKRIYLVADFAGGRAGKILFESEGLSGYSATSFRSWQRAAGSAADGTGTPGICLNDQGGQRMDTTEYGTGGNNQPFVADTPQAYGIGRDAFNQGKNAQYKPVIEEELQPTLVAKGPGAIGSGYTVRRLTPTECARLQGFPDWWCDGLETENLTESELEFWTQIFEEYRQAVKPESKPKTENQIKKWLKHPHSDSAEYKMWGNGVALPCVVFVLAGIKYYHEKEEQNGL